MKTKLIIMLTLLVSFNACKNANQNAAKEVLAKTQPATTKYAGIYSFGTDEEKPNGKVYIYPESDSTVLFYLYINRGAPSYNMGTLTNRLKVVDGIGLFEKKIFEDAENDCALKFVFKDNSLQVSENKETCDCAFGHAVYINHEFMRINKETPQFYPTTSSENMYFSELQEQLKATVEEQELPNESVFEQKSGEGVECKEYQEDGGYTTVSECTYYNKNLQQVYDIVKKADKHLKVNLPSKNIEYNDENNEGIAVSYKYKTQQHLFIEIQYAGGITSIELNDKGNKVDSKIRYSAD